MRLAVDTNILAYAEGVDGRDHQERAWDILESLSGCELLIPMQVAGELFNVLIKKGKRTRSEARQAVLAWHDSYRFINIEEGVTLAAMELSAQHNLGIWDAVILAASAEAECQLLLSEDMHHGFVWSGTTVVNPFLGEPHPLLAAHLQK